MTAGSAGIARAVVLGAGAVGTMFAAHLRDSGADVCLVDIHEAPDGASPRGLRRLCGDATRVDDALARELRVADAVVLALPEPVALAALAPVAGLLAPGAVLADTLSVKCDVAAAAARAVPETVQVVGLNPMFAPSLGMAGRPVAAVVVRDGHRVQALLDLVGEWGGRIVRQSAEEHDRLAAATQALTHAAVLAFGSALATLDVDPDALATVAPPPHQALLSLLARIVSGAPEVYWDIQSANPHAAHARDALAEGLARLDRTVAHGAETDFRRDLDRLRAFFGPRLAPCRARSDHLLTALHDGAKNEG